MDKFGMSFGGGPSKKELHETIESQKKQLIQYQTRFKDVVRAYKSLLNEKEALEASLKVLTVSQEVNLSQRCDDGSTNDARSAAVTSDLPDDHCSFHSEDSLDTAASVTSEGARGEPVEELPAGAPTSDTDVSGAEGLSLGQRAEPEAKSSECGSSGGGPEQLQQQQPLPSPAAIGPVSSPSVEADRRVLHLRTQLSTLTSSLATVTQEKSRMEASFQADKRNIKQELEELQARLEDERRQHDAQLKASQEQLAESKARVITQQHERAQEQGDHALMLRELQKLLQEERDLRQDAELKLEDARGALLESEQAADRGAEYEARLRETTEERERMRRSLRAAEVERNKPDPRVEELQQEVAELKSHYQQQLQHEIRKASQAEERACEQTQAEEGRVASLEERVSELSELLGASEKAKQRDQQTIHRLRERLLQLDTENKTLAIAASTRVSGDLSMEEANLDVSALKEKMERVKKLLLLASRRSPEQTLEIEKLAELEVRHGTGGGGEKHDRNASESGCQQELRQLREEFERYKLRAQVVLKNKNTKDGCQAKELEDARDQLAELKEKYINLRIHSDEAEAKRRQEGDEREQQLVALQHGHKQELERGEAVHREGLLRLESELHKQRERTMALLAEKDQELEKLRSAALGYGPSGQGSRSGNVDGNSARAVAEGGGARGGGSSSSSEEANAHDSAQEESEIIAQVLRLAGPNEPTLLLYAEQLARREVEVGSLRRQKRQLEEDIHQLQGKLIAKGEHHEEEVGTLQAQLDKQLRDHGREGANLEYLKNVIYKFLTLQVESGRQQTLGAILTILHFSPQEKQHVFKMQGQTWWPVGKR